MTEQGMKLLIIEDDIPFANSVKRRLEKKGYACFHIDQFEQALLGCHHHKPDYVLIDLKLHNESGLSLITPIRQLLPQARIILLTGYASIATAVDAIKLGADDYLSKPVDTQTLLAALSNCKVNELNNESVVMQEEELLTPLASTLSAEQAEWQHIQQVLKFNDGNVSATARQLSMHRRTLQRKLQKRPS